MIYSVSTLKFQGKAQTQNIFVLVWQTQNMPDKKRKKEIVLEWGTLLHDEQTSLLTRLLKIQQLINIRIFYFIVTSWTLLITWTLA